MKKTTTQPPKPNQDAPKRPPRGFGVTDMRVLTNLGSLPAAKRKSAAAAARNTVSDGTASLMDQLDHITDCVMIDTIGLEVHNAHVDLPTTKASVNAGLAVDEETLKGFGRAKRESGKMSFHIECRKLPKKQRLADAAALAAGGSPAPKPGSPAVRMLESMIYIEGSPAKHFQGHNIVGSSDVTMLAHDMVKAVFESHKFELPRSRRLVIAQGRDVMVTRLDVAVLVKLPEGIDKAAVVNAIALALTLNGSNIMVFNGESVYCDPTSQLRALKAYDKAAELEYRKGFDLPDTESGRVLVDICDNTLRLEFVFRRKYFASHAMFREHPVYPQRFDPSLLALMVIEELARTRLFDKLIRRYNPDELLSVPMPYRMTLAHWQHGGDVRKLLGDEEAEVHRSVLQKRFKQLDIFKAAPVTLPDTLRFVDLLHPRNFIPVPVAIKADPALFHASDMGAEIERQRTEINKEAQRHAAPSISPGFRNVPIPSPVQARRALLAAKRNVCKPGQPRKPVVRQGGIGTVNVNPYIDWDARRAQAALLGYMPEPNADDD